MFLISLLSLIALHCTFSQHFNEVFILIYKENHWIKLNLATEVNSQLQVEDIIIEEQTVEVLQSGTFAGLNRLKYVKIQHCGLKELQKSAFQNLTRLSVVNLSYNQLTKLEKGVFNRCGVTKLYLVANALNEIDENALVDLRYLEVLDLSRNKLVNLPRNLLKELVHLKEINLSHNEITLIPYTFFQGAFNQRYENQESLIDLSHNNLTYLSYKSLQGVTYLQNLLLNNNQITQLDHNLFDDFKKIMICNLEGNMLKALDLNLLAKCEQEELFGNPWECGFVRKYTNLCVKNEKRNTLDEISIGNCIV